MTRGWLIVALLLAAAMVYVGVTLDPTPAPIVHLPTEGHP